MADELDLTPLQALEDELRPVEQGTALDSLSDHVRECFREAREYRRSKGIDARMQADMRAVANEYDPEDLAILDQADSVYMPVTSTKVHAAQAWINDILSSTDSRPWTLMATPDPELSDDMETVVAARLQAEIEASASLGADMSKETLKDRARVLKALARRYVAQSSAEAVKGMETRLADELSQGRWRKTFGDFVRDLVTFPVAVVSGPFIDSVSTLKWDGSDIVAVEGLRKVVCRVDPFDFYVAPGSTTTQDGAYVIEVMRFDRSALLALVDVPGMDELGVRAALAEYTSGYEVDGGILADIPTGPILSGTSGTSGVGDSYEVLVYHGRVMVDMLQQHGVDLDGDPQDTIEAEVWVVGDYIVKAVANPHPLGTRPYFATSFRHVQGEFWGRSLPSVLHDIQRITNACVRSIVRNMGYSSGPVVEIDASRMPAESDTDEIFPYRVYHTVTDSLTGSQGPAMRFNQAPNVTGELLRVFDEMVKRADDISGIPAYVMGNIQVAGAGRTLGGLSMLMANAAKGIKQVISNVDRDIIEPVLESYYALEMLFGTDDSIKADAKVVARGAAGILQRELNQARMTEMMQTLTPFLSDPEIVPKKAVVKLLRGIMGSMGFDADEFLDDPDRATRVAEVTGATPGSSSPGSEPPSPSTSIPSIGPLTRGRGMGNSVLNLPQEPELDARSAPADSAAAVNGAAPFTGVFDGVS